MARTAPFAAGVCYSIFHPTWWPNPLQTQTSGQRWAPTLFEVFWHCIKSLSVRKNGVGNHFTLDLNQNKHEQKICHYILYLYQITSNHVRRLFPLTLVLFNCFPSLISTLPVHLGAQAHSARSLRPRRTRDKPSKLP